jgi:hypothetical protein
MPIPINTILNWSPLANNRQAAVINELIPGGLDDLALYTPKEVKEATKSFRTNTVIAQRFSLSANSTKRLMQLLYWVKKTVFVSVKQSNLTIRRINNRDKPSEENKKRMQKG